MFHLLRTSNYFGNLNNAQIIQKEVYNSGFIMVDAAEQLLNAGERGRNTQNNHEKTKSAKKGKKDQNDDENRGGGLLEPLIEDLQGWIKQRKPRPQSIN